MDSKDGGAIFGTPFSDTTDPPGTGFLAGLTGEGEHGVAINEDKVPIEKLLVKPAKDLHPAKDHDVIDALEHHVVKVRWRGGGVLLMFWRKLLEHDHES